MKMKKTTVISFVKAHRREIFWFCVPPLMALAYYAMKGEFIKLGPDAKLYYSIAENFCATGHFIQIDRDSALFVVPFGVPLILTILRMIGFTLPMIVALQYLMLGTACMLLYKTERILFGKGGFAPIFYCVALFRARISLSDIYLEHYFLLLTVVLLYLSVRTDMADRKRLTLMNLTGMYMVACRPVLIPAYIAVLIYTLVLVCRRRITAGRFAVLLLIPVLVFGANTLVNYRETGYPIVMDSYSGDDFYWANNPNASADYYSRDVAESFGEEYWAVWRNPELDRVKKNELLKEMGTEWILNNPGRFLSNTIQKFKVGFIEVWRYALVACFLGALHMFAALPEWRRWNAVTLLCSLIIAFVTSMGLMMTRYTIVVWPLAALHLASLAYPILRWLGKRLKKQKA